MQFVGGIVIGIVGTLIVNDPGMMSEIFHWLGDAVNNEEIRNELSGNKGRYFGNWSTCVVG